MNPLHAVAIAAIAALAALPAPAAAFHVGPVPLLDEVHFDAESYVAYRVLVPEGGFVGFEVSGASEDASFVSFALWMVDPDTHEFSGLFNPTWYEERGVEASLSLADPVGEVPATEGARVTYEPLLLLVDFEPFATGEWLFIMMAGFDGDVEGRFRLTGREGTEVLGRSTGAAFMHRETDFRGTVNADVMAAAPVRDLVVEAKVAEDVSVEERAASSMFAHFRGESHLNELRMGVDGPSGSRDGHEWYLVSGEKPGDYRFRIDRNVDWHDNTPVCRVANGGEQCWRAPTWVIGADVAPPA